MKTRMILALGFVVFTLSILAGDFEGIGLVILDRKSANEPLRTGTVLPGSPAALAGVTPNGFLISVDGTNVVSMSLAQSMGILRGPVGTSITLEIADEKRSATNKFTVKVGWAKEYRLVQTYIVDGANETNTTLLAAYILNPPDNSSRAVVFKTFDSKGMEEWLSGLPYGSVVIYDTNGFLPQVERAKREALKNCCEKKGVTFCDALTVF